MHIVILELEEAKHLYGSDRGRDGPSLERVDDDAVDPSLCEGESGFPTSLAQLYRVVGGGGVSEYVVRSH